MAKGKIKGWWSKFIRILKITIISFFALSIVSVVLFRWVNPPVSPLMLLRCCQNMFNEHPVRIKKSWKDLNHISQYLPKAVITSEDQKFKTHWGFDVEAIMKAYKNNDKGRKRKGGSTISQQTAKNVFLCSSSSWVRKGFEVYFTALIEIFWSKERIMEVYLNIIEMGDGIYGAEAASQEYFHKPAKALNRKEAALIAACLPNPRRWTPVKPSKYIAIKQQWIMRNLDHVGRVVEEKPKNDD